MKVRRATFDSERLVWRCPSGLVVDSLLVQLLKHPHPSPEDLALMMALIDASQHPAKAAGFPDILSRYQSSASGRNRTAASASADHLVDALRYSAKTHTQYIDDLFRDLYG